MQVIEYMNKDGYFKTYGEYQKSLNWARKGIIPKFMQRDYEYYRDRLKEERKKGKSE